MTTTARSFGRVRIAPVWALLLVLALLIAIVAVGLTVGDWRLTPIPVQNGPIVFGRFDAAVNDTVIHISRPDGSDSHMVRSGANQCPQFSPDGRQLSVGFGTLAIADATLQRFTNTFDGVTLGCTTWSPDGRRLAAEGWSDADPSLNGIFLADSSDGGNKTRLTTNGQGGNDIPGDFSPDGRRVAFVRGYEGREAGTIWVADLGTGAAREVIPNAVGNSVSWSPDGEWLFAHRALVQGMASKFMLVRPDGSDLRMIDLPDLHNWATAPSFSPDGARLVFNMAVGTSDNADIYTMTLDGSDIVQVTNTPNDNEYFVDWGIDPS